MFKAPSEIEWSYSAKGRLCHSSCEYSSSKKLVAVRDHRVTRIFDIESRKCMARTDAPHDGQCRFSNSGSILATMNDYQEYVYLWDMVSLKVVKTFKHRDLVFACAFAPSDNVMITASDAMYAWDVSTGQKIGQLAKLENAVLRLDVSRNNILASVSNQQTDVRLWDVSRMQFLRSLNRHVQPCRWCVFAADGTMLASVSSDALCLWDMRTRDCIGIPKNIKPYQQCSFSSDGTYLAVTCKHDVRVWDTRMQRTISMVASMQSDSGVVSGCCFIDKDMLATVSARDKLNGWNINIWK